MINKDLLNQVFSTAQLELIYDALSEYEIIAEGDDEENGDNERSDLLSSVINIIVNT
jgi:hypothetical protein